MKYLGWLLGIENVTGIDGLDPALAAAWAEENTFWIIFAAIALVALSLIFYLRFQQRGSRRTRASLGLVRGALLAMLLLTLANPVLRITITQLRKPLFYVLFDGTESMSIADEFSSSEQQQLQAKTGLERSADGKAATRVEYVRAFTRREQDNLLLRLQKDKGVQLEAFVFDDRGSGQLRKLRPNDTGGDQLDAAFVADQLTADGQVTAVGSALLDVSQQIGAKNLVGLIMFSDFAHNTGVAPLGTGEASPAVAVRAPIYAVGVGAPEAIDMAVTLQTDPKMKRAERSNVQVKLRQVGLQGENATVKLVARRQTGSATDGESELVVGTRTVSLDASVVLVDFPFTPKDAGRFLFTATAEPHAGEVIAENNVASREVNVIDDFLRLLYIANEPTWEWRFIKEVFHRDKLVGMDGFRTFLSSSDPRVRQSNVLFVPTLTPPRREFFANDVIFLGDMPPESLNNRFCEMAKEYVGNLGGGLVVLGGPRFGPQALASTPLADMLPVILDENATLQADREFRLQFTPHAARQPFMQLGRNEIENSEAWNNLGPLPWFQPVAAIHPQATVLAQHPTEKCRDGKTPMPLIAVRNYGKGEVVYLGFNETWRLRPRYGERYYRRFWSQLIYRLGMSHALGADKRFAPSLDRQQYRSGDKAVLTVEAYDENYDPLTEDDLPARSLEGELTSPGDGGVTQTRALTIPFLRNGVFEARLPVFTAGEYVVRVKDPVTNEFQVRRFEVTELSSERRRATRDSHLQNELARATQGRAYDLTTVDRLVDELNVEPIPEKLTRNHALWSTPLWFLCVVGLMLIEWLCRKLIHLA